MTPELWLIVGVVLYGAMACCVGGYLLTRATEEIDDLGGGHLVIIIVFGLLWPVLLLADVGRRIAERGRKP